MFSPSGAIKSKYQPIKLRAPTNQIAAHLASQWKQCVYPGGVKMWEPIRSPVTELSAWFLKKKHIGSVKLPAPLCHRFKGDGDLDASKRDGLRLLFMQQQQQQQMCARVACFSSGIRQQYEILSFYLFKKTKKGKTKVCSLFCSVFNCGENLNCCRIFLNICQ